MNPNRVMTNFPDLVFHHVGIASTSIAEEEKSFLLLGYVRETEIITDSTQKLKALFMTLGNMRIELLEPLSADSPVNAFIQRGIKMYHQAFFCGDILKTIDFFLEQGAYLAVPPVSAIAFNGRKIAFLMLRNKMLIEIIESPR